MRIKNINKLILYFSINVELVVGDGCTKYVCYYVMKGADMAFVEMKNDPDPNNPTFHYDEFNQIRMARYITSMEAFLSLWGCPLIKKSHIVCD